MEQQKKQSTEGKPMFVESLMSHDEWERRRKQYPGTSHVRYEDANKNVPNPFKWRYRMGDSLTADEISLFNKRIDAVIKKAKESQ